jgi:predicted aldo/keto reductase-like oxidoreductase
VFEAGTRTMRFGPVPAATGHYEWILSNGSGRASDCISCHACEANCPQHLEIASLMAHCAALLDR